MNSQQFFGRHLQLTRTLALLLSISLAWTPFAVAWGDALQNAGAAGQQTGQDLLANFQFPVESTTGNMTLNPGTAQQSTVTIIPPNTHTVSHSNFLAVLAVQSIQGNKKSPPTSVRLHANASMAGPFPDNAARTTPSCRLLSCRRRLLSSCRRPCLRQQRLLRLRSGR